MSLKKRYRETIQPKLQKDLSLTNIHEVPKVLDYMDALSAGMHRRANNETRLFMKAYQWLLRTEGTRLARYESRVLDYFDGATLISRNDRLLTATATAFSSCPTAWT